MNIGAYNGAAAMAALEKWQEATAQNIASASVPGFKRSDVKFESRLGAIMRLDKSAGLADTLRGSMPLVTSRIDFAQGELKQTGIETDFAIEGPGFFQVQRPDGTTGYTRNGSFHLNDQRILVTQQGFTVQGESGPLTFRPRGGPISIDAEGQISQGTNVIGKLTITNFPDPTALRRGGDGLLIPRDATAQSELVEKPRILSGSIETSNVQPLREMVNLIAVSRAYEAARESISNDDHTAQQAIEILGAPSA